MLEHPMEYEVSKDIERLFEPGSESALQSYIACCPADVAELFHFVEADKWLQITGPIVARESR